MFRKLAVLLLVLSSIALRPHSSMAQAWKLNLDMSIYTPSISDDGKTLILFTKKSFQCYDATTGTLRWSRDLEKYIPGFSGKFINNSIFVYGLGNQYEFIDVNSGKTVKTLPIIGESWKDLRWDSKALPETDTLKPHFWGNVGIFYWDDGFQLIDLEKQTILYQSSEPIKVVKYETDGDMTMIWSRRGADTAYFLDTKNNKIAYKIGTSSNGINGSVYKHFFVQGDQMLIMLDKNFASVNLPTQHIDALIPVSPDDPDVYIPVAGNNALYLLTSDHNKQTLYDGKSGAQMWQTKEDEIPGLAEQFTLIDQTGNDGLLMSYHKDGKIGISKVNMKTGAIAWTKILAEQDGSYAPGHHKSSSTLAILKTVALTIVTNAVNRGLSRAGSYNSRSGWGASNNNSFNSMNQHAPNIAGALASTNVNQESAGFVKVLEIGDGKVSLLLGGKMYTELSKTSRDNYDGEGFVILSLADGSVIKNMPCPIIAKSSDKKNAAKDLTATPIGPTNVVVGAHDVYVLYGDKLESFNFGEENVTSIGSDDIQVQFVCNHDDDYYDYWSIEPTPTGAKKTLLARSTKNNLVFQGTSAFASTLNIDKKAIEAYPLMTGDAAAKPAFTNPSWKLTEDDLDKLDVGSLAKNASNSDSIQGIRVSGNDLYLMGSDKIGKVTINQTCRWANKWSPEPLQTLMGVTPYGKCLVYETGKYCGILNNDCSGAEIATHKISPEYATVLHSPEDDLIVMDRDNGLVFCYKLKKD